MPKAGLFAGEVTQQAPADGAATTKQKGYHWFEWGTDILDVEPTSAEFALNKGFSATTNGYWTSDPVWPHPLFGNSYPEWTVSAVFQSSTKPTFADPDQNLFSVAGSSNFGVGYHAGTNAYYVRCHMRSYSATRTNYVICQDNLRVQSGAYLHWLITDWYCVTGSYNQVTATYKVSYVNLTRGEEVVQIGTISDNDNIEFNNAHLGSDGESMWWGGMGTYTGANDSVINPWIGTIANIFIHNKYVDVSSESVRRLFSGIDGIVDVGSQGQHPFGETPFVYMPSGGPWDNRGTVNVGTYNTKFFIVNPPEIGTNLPPIAS